MVHIIFGAAEMTNIFGKVILWLFTGIQNYALTVIVFTLLFKLVLSPLDFWSKRITRKNAKATKIMAPKLEQLKREVGGNQQLYFTKQREIQKQHGYSTFGACLPTLITLVLFFVILGGYTARVKYQNEDSFDKLSKTYYSAEYDTRVAYLTANSKLPTGFDALDDAGKLAAVEETIKTLDASEKAAMNAEIETVTKAAVVTAYAEYSDSFLWVKNIFMPDAPWSKVVPDYGLFSGTEGGFLGLGRLNVKIEGLDQAEYNKIMGPIMETQNTGKVNGFLILPLLCFALNILMTKLNPQSQQPVAPPTFNQDSAAAAKQSKTTQKTMMFMMPAMMLLFALFYSSAFTLYILVSTSFTIIFNLIFNLIYKKRDKVEEEVAENTTYVRKSELEAMQKQKEKEEKEKEEKEKEEKAKKILEKTNSKFGKDIDKF
ncbi:MAG: YidC/Oxa1 family membrane protein insertase [Clostridiales bacterium]|jgi:YidC/Oxa1 family membrane protein insertase|nr:YidC/Oxa1 family membrane protein insertase [Clostridiales bacterium]